MNVALNCDLHTHSTISDGVLTPEALVERAFKNGVRLFALTDHDEVDGVARARLAAQACGMQFLSGVEVSVSWANTTIHVVGLQVDENDPALIACLEQNRSGRFTRAEEIAARFDKLGIHGTLEGTLRYVTNIALVSRKHFARHLVDAGVCTTLEEAFRRYLREGRPCFVKHPWASLKDAVSWIHEAGGRAVVAHPGRYRISDTMLHAFLEEFRQLGGEGIEVVTGSHGTEQYQQFAQIARYYGFMASLGSDFHSPTESPMDVGQVPVLPAGLTPVWHDWF